MTTAHLDHLVLAAHSLTQGVEYIREKLGVEPQGGGQHASQGTHNRLLRLDRGCYLEIISIDPDGNRPGHPRWFDLDSRKLQAKLLERPRLITWVARTDDIHSLVKLCKIDIGQVRPMSRGQLRWPNDPVAAISANFSSHQISLGYMQDPFGRTFGNDRTQLGEHSN